MKRLLKVFLGTICAGSSVVLADEGLRPIDDVRFILDIRHEEVGTGGRITSTAVGDRLRWSAVPSVMASENTHPGEPISVTNLMLAANIHPMTTNKTPCLYFPQSDYYDVDGYDHVSCCKLTLGGAAVTGVTQTAFLRFRWDGSSVTNFGGNHCWLFLNGYDWSAVADDGNKGVGWGVYIDNIAKDEASGKIGVLVRHASGTQDINQSISVGKWYDLFVTVAPSDENSAESVCRTYLIATPAMQTVEGRLVFKKPSMSIRSVTRAAVIKNDPSFSSIAIGAEDGYTSYVKITTAGSGAAKTFRGAMAEMMIWNRLLTEEEMWQVASGYHGSTWAVGAINGSSDEFATSDAAEEFHVTNNWRFMRRDLTAACPSLRLLGAMTDADATMGHVLQIVPVESSVPRPCPLRVDVCGKNIGTFDIADKFARNIFIPERFWTRDSDGNVDVTLSRPGIVEGTLSIDALTLSGSWCIGTINNSNDGSPETAVINSYIVGDPHVTTHRMRATGHASAGYESQHVWMWIPRQMTQMPFKYTLDLKLLSMQSVVSGSFQAAFYANDMCVGTFSGLKANDFISLTVPPELLVAGMNVFSFSNAVPPNVSNNAWCNYDYFRLKVKYLRGTILVFK